MKLTKDNGVNKSLGSNLYTYCICYYTNWEEIVNVNIKHIVTIHWQSQEEKSATVPLYSDHSIDSLKKIYLQLNLAYLNWYLVKENIIWRMIFWGDTLYSKHPQINTWVFFSVVMECWALLDQASSKIKMHHIQLCYFRLTQNKSAAVANERELS